MIFPKTREIEEPCRETVRNDKKSWDSPQNRESWQVYTRRFRIEGFDLYLHIDAEFALRDTGRCDSKKFFVILQMTIFLFFFFYFINKKNRK